MMRAIQAESFAPDFEGLRVVDIVRPSPEAGEVLIEVSCAPVNPADEMMVGGTYIRDTKPPFVPGLVGVGTVRASGSGILPMLLRNRRVVFAATRGKSGSWAEYTVAPASLCVPVPRGMSDEGAVNLLANGATGVALVETARADGHKALVITAAASEVAGMVAIEARRAGMPVVGVVRREEQRATLMAEGRFEEVVVGSGPGDRDAIAAGISRHRVTAAIDAVAGSMTETLMEALPDGGTVYALGRLSGENASFDVMRHLIGRDMRLKGFAIDRWFMDRNLPSQLRAVSRAQRLLQAAGGTKTAARYGLEEAVAALPRGSARPGKLLILPGVR